MQQNPMIYQLYAVTAPAADLAEQVKRAIAGGITMLQIREKNCTTKRRIELAYPILQLCRDAGIPCIIDDDAEAAKILGADGVHVGQRDMKIQQAREILGSEPVPTMWQKHYRQNGTEQLIWGVVLCSAPGPSTMPLFCPMMCSAIFDRQCLFRWWRSAASMLRISRSCTIPALTAWQWFPRCSDSRTWKLPHRKCGN